MPMEVVVSRPMTDRNRIPMAKVRLRLENGTSMTIIDWEITHGLMLLLPLEVPLLGLIIRATTCDRSADVFLAPPRSSYSNDSPLFYFCSSQCHPHTKLYPKQNRLKCCTSDNIMDPAAIEPRSRKGKRWKPFPFSSPA